LWGLDPRAAGRAKQTLSDQKTEETINIMEENSGLRRNEACLIAKFGVELFCLVVLLRNRASKPTPNQPMKKNFLLIVLTLAAVLLPAFGEDAGKKLRIVFCPPNMKHTWNVAAARAAEADAKKLGVQIIVQDGQGNSPKQSSDLRNAVNQGVDGIVLGANDIHALVPAVNDVIAAGIPIVTFDRYVEGTTQKVPFFGLDNVAGGALLAKYVIDKFPNGAKIFFLTGQPGSSPAIDRAKGVHDTLKAAGDKYQILSEQTGNWMRDQGLSVTQNMLTSYGSTPDAIIASNDDMALGVLEALEQAGIPQNKVLVLGCDTTPEALAKIRDGVLAGSVEFPLKQVTMAIDAIVAHIRENKPVEGKLLDPVLIEKSNLTTAERYAELK
jgi:inositol transport system substrate-binding protein